MNVTIHASDRVANTTGKEGPASRGRYQRYATKEIHALYPNAAVRWIWSADEQDFAVVIAVPDPAARYQIWATLHDAAQEVAQWATPLHPHSKAIGHVSGWNGQVPRSGFTPIITHPTCSPAHVMLVENEDGSSTWIDVDEDEARQARRSGFVRTELP